LLAGTEAENTPILSEDTE